MPWVLAKLGFGKKKLGDFTGRNGCVYSIYIYIYLIYIYILYIIYIYIITYIYIYIFQVMANCLVPLVEREGVGVDLGNMASMDMR